MRGVVMHAPGDVRVEDRPEPTILKPTDAIIRLSATCVCGSDLWPYRGADEVSEPTPMGHEYAGIVEEVGAEVTTIKPGQFVVGSFFASDNTCEICRAGYQTSCIHREPGAPDGAQAQRMRVPLADGTLVATPEVPDDDLVPDFLAASDVLGTGWFGAVAAEAGPGKTVAVVGDGAVGLLAVLAAQQLGAERIIAMSRHQPRQQLAREFGATDIVEERGDEGVAKIKELTDGLGAHSVVEAVGTQGVMQAPPGPAARRFRRGPARRRPGDDRSTPRPPGGPGRCAVPARPGWTGSGTGGSTPARCSTQPRSSRPAGAGLWTNAERLGPAPT
jgi:threonine dehydrogenase-like Zn-dependent dehydrogenase